MALADPQGAGDRPTTIWLPSGANFVSRLPPQPRNRGTEEPRNRGHSLGNEDGQRPNPGHIRLPQGIESDNHRSEGYKHLSTSRYSNCQPDVSVPAPLG